MTLISRKALFHGAASKGSGAAGPRVLAAKWVAVTVVGGGIFIGACGGITQPLGDSAAGSSGTLVADPGANQSPCETECVHKVFAGTAAACKLCHAATPAPYGLQSSGLDLESPNVAPRLKDVPAKHLDLPPATNSVPATCPVGDKLIDSVNPGNSWLLKKVRGLHGNCGTEMPQASIRLTIDEIQCVQTFVNCVAAE